MIPWLEVEARDKNALRIIYALADQHGCASIHHFQEPWFPDGSVVRIHPTSDESYAAITTALSDGTFTVWDASGDESLFGDDWPAVQKFFEAASRLALVSEPGDWNHRKWIHCAMNSWGYGREDEIRAALRMAYGHMRLLLHCATWRWFHRRGSCKHGCHTPDWQS